VAMDCGPWPTRGSRLLEHCKLPQQGRRKRFYSFHGHKNDLSEANNVFLFISMIEKMGHLLVVLGNHFSALR